MPDLEAFVSAIEAAREDFDKEIDKRAEKYRVTLARLTEEEFIALHRAVREEAMRRLERIKVQVTDDERAALDRLSQRRGNTGIGNRRA